MNQAGKSATTITGGARAYADGWASAIDGGNSKKVYARTGTENKLTAAQVWNIWNRRRRSRRRRTRRRRTRRRRYIGRRRRYRRRRWWSTRRRRWYRRRR